MPSSLADPPTAAASAGGWIRSTDDSEPRWPTYRHPHGPVTSQDATLLAVVGPQALVSPRRPRSWTPTSAAGHDQDRPPEATDKLSSGKLAAERSRETGAGPAPWSHRSTRWGHRLHPVRRAPHRVLDHGGRDLSGGVGSRSRRSAACRQDLFDDRRGRIGGSLATGRGRPNHLAQDHRARRTLSPAGAGLAFYRARPSGADQQGRGRQAQRPGGLTPTARSFSKSR
jgi:hypothetical protein